MTAKQYQRRAHCEKILNLYFCRTIFLHFVLPISAGETFLTKTEKNCTIYNKKIKHFTIILIIVFFKSFQTTLPTVLLWCLVSF